MKCKQKKQTFLIVFLLAMLTLQLYLSHVKAESLIVNIQNGKIYYPTNTVMRFQHLGVRYLPTGATITLTVTSGILNGSSMSLAMYSTQGTLTFTSNDVATISLTSTNNQTIFHINHEAKNSASIASGSNYQIQWTTLEPEFLLPVMFILGMVGLGGTILGPVYAAYQIKEGHYYEGFKNGLLITVLCLALTIAWLWSGVPVTGGMTVKTKNFSLSEPSGYVWGASFDYLTARSTPTSYKYGYAYDINVGQLIWEDGQYCVIRAFLKFDTSSISSANIESVKLYVYGGLGSPFGPPSFGGWDIVVQKWTGNTPIDTGDYNQFDNIAYGYVTPSSSWSWLCIELNPNIIQQYTKICLRSSKDIASLSPSVNEYGAIFTHDPTSDLMPRLEVKYYEG